MDVKWIPRVGDKLVLMSPEGRALNVWEVKEAKTHGPDSIITKLEPVDDMDSLDWSAELSGASSSMPRISGRNRMAGKIPCPRSRHHDGRRSRIRFATKYHGKAAQ